MLGLGGRGLKPARLREFQADGETKLVNLSSVSAVWRRRGEDLDELSTQNACHTKRLTSASNTLKKERKEKLTAQKKKGRWKW